MALYANAGGRGLISGLPFSEGAENMVISKVKVRILKSCYVDKQVRKIGDVVVVPEPQARELCWMKKAELVKPEPAPVPPAKAPEAGKEKKEEGKEKKGGEGK
jgi:hypothetical protein